MNSQEEAVGISQFANPDILRFTGYLKKRYADFVVDEVDLDGKVAELTDVLIEDSAKPAVTEEPSEALDQDLGKLLKEELGDMIEDALVKDIMMLEEEPGEPVLSKSIPEKSDRTRFHSAIRKVFNGRLVTDTVDDRVRIMSKGTDPKRTKVDRRNFQDPNRLPMVKFVLWKEFMETLEAVQIIARKIGINPKDISYAGTKDRRAVTSQFVTIRHVNPAKIAGCNGAASGKIKISNARAVKEALSLGDLSGNRFTLLLRQVTASEDSSIRAALESLSTKGFINYYGLQRFGSMSVKSHDIGIQLLQGKWQEAIDLILGPRDDESDGMAREARRCWADQKDAKAAHDLFPFRYNAERQILWHFHKQANHNDLVGALLSVNRELRLMYVHSVQSLVWNRAVSERVKKFGLVRPIVGDLVMGEGIPPTLVTQNNIDQFSIYDVVLPLPGYDIKKPSGDLGVLYNKVLSEEFHLVSQDCFQPKSKALWDLPGAYRYIMAKPKSLQYSIGYYDGVNSDVAELKQNGGEFKAVRVSFELPTSSYATMAIREVMEVLLH